MQSVVLPGATINLIILSIVCLLLLLSGDVELNPGPTLYDKPEISLLIEWLDPLVEWQPFAYRLPKIEEHDIPKIETESSNLNERKRKLYSKWLSVCPEATWNDVIKALETNRENALAHNIKEKIKSSSNDSSTDAMPAGKAEVMFKTNEEEEEVSQKLTDDVVRKLAADRASVFDMESLLPVTTLFSFTPSPSPTSPPASTGTLLLLLT